MWQVKLMYKISIESIGDVKKYVWHYRKDNKEYGPFTYEDIVGLVRNGEIGPEDYLFKFGNRKFFKASEVQGLFDGVAQPERKHEEKPVAAPVENPVAAPAVPEEKIDASREEPKEDFHMVFENRVPHTQAKHKREASGSKIIMIAAGLMGLCLAAWVLTRLL